MKKLTIIIAAIAMSFAASAQTTRVIKGAVVDKNGNPLPGATVTATGGSEVTTVDADGSFSLEVPIWLKSATAKYAGMADKKMKLSADDMIFQMYPKFRKQWFLIGDFAYLFDSENGMGGLMGGQLGKWGWYGKFLAGPTWGDVTWNVTAGVTKSIVDPLHIYVGFGGGMLSSEVGVFVPEIGLIGKIAKHFLVHAGYQCMLDTYGNPAHIINVGLGYAF